MNVPVEFEIQSNNIGLVNQMLLKNSLVRGLLQDNDTLRISAVYKLNNVNYHRTVYLPEGSYEIYNPMDELEPKKPLFGTIHNRTTYALYGLGIWFALMLRKK